MSAFGTTPGKALVGIKIAVPPGRRRLSFYFERELKVWILGVGMGLPFVSLFTQFYQFRRVKAGRNASYDGAGVSVLVDPNEMRVIAGAVVTGLLFAGNMYIRIEDQKASREHRETQDWINPVTQRKAHILQSWHSREIASDGGRAFYFASDTSLADAVFGYELLPNDGIAIGSYADAIKDVIASDVIITSTWTPVTVNGISALQASGKSKKNDDTYVEVTVAVIGKHAWRTIVFARGRPVLEEPEGINLVSDLFWTAS